MESQKASEAAPMPTKRNSLLSLVQGLGIKLPSECISAASKAHLLPLDFRLGESSPISPLRGRKPGCPKSFSPPASPRALSPAKPTRTAAHKVTSSERPASSPRSPKLESITFRKAASKTILKKAVKVVPALKLTPKAAVKPAKKKENQAPEAPAPVPLPLSQKEIEVSQAMVSPRIEFDSIKGRRASSGDLLVRKRAMPKVKQAQESRNLVLKSLVTKIDTSSDPSSEGSKSKAEVIYRKHLYQTFRGLKMARNLPPAEPIQLQAKRVVLMKPPGKYRPKTAIFDLDETLVHCLDRSETAVPDVVLPIRFPNGDIVHVMPNQASLKIRPYCNECLTEVSQDMEVIVFTASQRSYADAVISYIDPTRTLIHHRLYRESCVLSERVHVKDLRVLANRSLKDVVLIDNAAYSFGYQIDNGIPIISWHDDPEDKELLYLTQYLKGLLNADDVREVNQATFHLATFYNEYSDEFLPKEKPKGK